MKATSEMTIQELVAEWKQRHFVPCMAPDSDVEMHAHYNGRRDALARALDEKCEAAGLQINHKGQLEIDKYAETTVKAIGRKYVWFPIPAADLHLLLGYLLSKNP